MHKSLEIAFVQILYSTKFSDFTVTVFIRSFVAITNETEFLHTSIVSMCTIRQQLCIQLIKSGSAGIVGMSCRICQMENTFVFGCTFYVLHCSE